MSTNVTAIYVDSTTTATDYPTRIRGIDWSNASNAFTELVVRDASAAGTIIYKAGLPAGGSSNVYIEEAGIRAPNKVHVSVATSVYATIVVG